MPPQTLLLSIPVIEDVPERLAYQSPSNIEAVLGRPVRIDQRGVRYYRGRAGEFQEASVRFSAVGCVAVEFTFVFEKPSPPTPAEALARIGVLVAMVPPTVTAGDRCQWGSSGSSHKWGAVWEEALALRDSGSSGSEGWDRVQVRFP